MKYLIFFLIVFVFISNALAFEVGPPLTDREIIESLTELKAGQVSLDKRFDDIGNRIDTLRGGMKDGYARLDKRIDDMGNRIDDMKGLLYSILAGIFILIGFVLWDRRTTLAPAAKKYDALERALIDYSDKHPDLKESLRHAGLL